jgi:hypothetical protein
MRASPRELLEEVSRVWGRAETPVKDSVSNLKGFTNVIRRPRSCSSDSDDRVSGKPGEVKLSSVKEKRS